jgi:two-component system, NtrC family, C4-dicarboxylate transport response regulator DctD
LETEKMPNESVQSCTLRAVGGNILRLEQSLDTPRKTLYDKLTRYGLRPKDFRQASDPRKD